VPAAKKKTKRSKKAPVAPITPGPLIVGPPPPPLEIRRNNAYQRCALVALDISYVQKDGIVKVKTRAGGEFAYAAVTHDAVTKAIRAAVIEHGLMPRVQVTRHEFNSDLKMTLLEVVLSLHCIDDPSDRISHTGWGYGQDYGDKGPGKALSYAVKNLYLKAFMLETGEEDEERVPDPGSGVISAEELTELQDAMDAVGTDESDIIKYLSNSQGLDIRKMKHLPRRFLPMISATLKKKAKALE